MKPQEFNTLDQMAENAKIEELAAQAQYNIKKMQVDVPQIEIPGHVVLPLFQKEKQKEEKDGE